MMVFRGDIIRIYVIGLLERKGISWNMIFFLNFVGRRYIMFFDFIKVWSVVICFGFNLYVILIFCLVFVIWLKFMVFVEVKVEKIYVFCIILMKWKYIKILILYDWFVFFIKYIYVNSIFYFICIIFWVLIYGIKIDMYVFIFFCKLFVL